MQRNMTEQRTAGLCIQRQRVALPMQYNTRVKNRSECYTLKQAIYRVELSINCAV